MAKNKSFLDKVGEFGDKVVEGLDKLDDAFSVFDEPEPKRKKRKR